MYDLTKTDAICRTIHRYAFDWLWEIKTNACPQFFANLSSKEANSIYICF